MFDVIVIGAGGGGPVVAKELAARGLKVLVLEGGPPHARPRQEWTHFENDANNPLTGYLRFGPADRARPAWFRELPQNSFLFQVSGVGGTTQHYFGNCPRAYPGVFAGYDKPDADAYDTAHRFPFTYAELVPYYEWVEATLPVQTAAMGPKEQTFFRGCQAVGLPVQTTKTTLGDSFRPQQNAILQPGGNAGLTRDLPQITFPRATGCTQCGYCFQGCMEPFQAPRNLVAKRSTDNSYVPMALTADAWHPGGVPITLIADAFVTQIHTENQGGEVTATGVTWRVGATGEVFTETAKVVVLAAGTTESPRLWLNSGLPNPNDWVGRGYTDHYFDMVTGLFDHDTGSSKGPASAARAEFPGRGGMENIGLGPALQAFAMQLSNSGSRGFYTNGRGMTGAWDGPAGRPIGNELKDALMNGVDRMLNILVITDDDVEGQNRVSQSALPADEHGPVPKVEFKPFRRTPRTLANRELLANKAAQILRGAGAKKVFRLDWGPLILHVQSTMRMGMDPANSVLDASAEARWVKRLFIADNSALANALGGPNPTLTSQALATRTAEKIFQRYFGGDPWVGREAPVPSIADAVTQAVIARGI
ncbi:MAG TPA: GMC family oxidoreductase N-terminal domain-containing protein [Kofleriaceae bacterium]|nr:GMC family oxidoreductase N-terminal domain-containing protein [Kofleriaceae bacterium]